MCTRVCGCVWKLDVRTRSACIWPISLIRWWAIRFYGGRPRPPKGASEAFISTLRKFDRRALHATMLRLYHPISGIEMEWHAPIPQDMVELIEVMRADFEEHKDEVDWL